MSPRYPIPAHRHRVEEEIKRSRFLTTVEPVTCPAEARAFIDEMRREFPDATHNCWAYLTGPPGTSTHVGMSDDGEPHGTAGRPMLNVLSHAGVGDIAVVVTRYYGGTKLGKGGLVRAYGGGVRLALDALPLREKVSYRSARLVLAYTHINRLRLMMEARGILVNQEDFASDVSYDLSIPEEHWQAFSTEVSDLTAGDMLLEKDDALNGEDS